ncbi:MAG: hypothetical protein NVSMB1_10890 [Polyangiales bacterium]
MVALLCTPACSLEVDGYSQTQSSPEEHRDAASIGAASPDADDDANVGKALLENDAAPPPDGLADAIGNDTHSPDACSCVKYSQKKCDEWLPKHCGEAPHGMGND